MPSNNLFGVLGYIRGRDVGIGIGEARLENQIKSLLHIT